MSPRGKVIPGLSGPPSKEWLEWLESIRLTQAEAEEFDEYLVGLDRRRKARTPASACRMMYLMSTRGCRLLGHPTFRAYLEARRLRPSWAKQLRGVYARLCIQLGVAEQDWQDIPLSQLQGALTVIDRDNVRPILSAARQLSREQFRRHLRRGQVPFPVEMHRLGEGCQPALASCLMPSSVCNA